MQKKKTGDVSLVESVRDEKEFRASQIVNDQIVDPTLDVTDFIQERTICELPWLDPFGRRMDSTCLH